jgi:Cyclic nucleotide-binding domain
VRVEGATEIAAAVEAEPIRRSITTGFRALADAPADRLLIGLGPAQAFVRGCLNVLVIVIVFRALHGGDGEVGYLTAAIGVGGLVGAFGAMTLESRRLGAIFGTALVFWGLPIALMAPGPNVAAAIFLLAVVGLANSVEDVALVTLLQPLVPDDRLTSVFGVLWGLAMGGVAVGSIVVAPVVGAVGPRAALIAIGMILPLLGLATYRRLVEIDRRTAPAEELELIERVPMFAPLSIAAKERLAASLVPVSVAAGEVVIRVGDVGDRFYAVGDGELEIDAGGLLRVAQDGDYFGEIAPLRDLPRTANVTAAVASQLYALDVPVFHAVVAGHEEARAAGEQIVEARLAGVAAAG